MEFNVPKEEQDDSPLENFENCSAQELYDRGFRLTMRKDHNDQNKGFDLLKMAADKGSCSAMFMIANLSMLRGDDRISKSEVIKYLRKGCELEDASCMDLYASLLKDGNGVPQDKELALKYYEKSMEKNNKQTNSEYEKLKKEIE